LNINLTIKVAVLYSGGKDSNLALYKASKFCEISCLITILPKNKDSFMFQSSNVNITELQAKALGLPLIKKETEGKKEEELNDLYLALKEAKEKYKIEGVVTGALFSVYQNSRIQKIADELNLFVFSPLWLLDQEKEIKELINLNFDVLITKISAWPLTFNHLGKRLSEIFDFLIKNKKYLNVAGEGGEYETIVLDQPLFKKKILVEKVEKIKYGENEAELIIKKAKLVDKN